MCEEEVTWKQGYRHELPVKVVNLYSVVHLGDSHALFNCSVQRCRDGTLPISQDPENMSPPPFFLYTTFRQKWRRCNCSNIQFISRIHLSQSLLCMRSTIKKTTAAFWRKGNFDVHVLQDFSRACVHTKSRGIEATCIVSGNRGWSRVSLCSQCEYSQQQS